MVCLQSLLPAMFHTLENPSHIGRGLDEKEPDQLGNDEADVGMVAEVKTNCTKANCGMWMMEMRPE